MVSGPLPTDLRIQVPRRSLAAWYRVSGQFEPLMRRMGTEPNPANLLAAMLEVLDGLKNPNRLPSADPNSPFEEWPDGRGVTVTGGRIVRRLDPGIDAEPHPYEAPPRFAELLPPYDPDRKAADQLDLVVQLRMFADRLERDVAEQKKPAGSEPAGFSDDTNPTTFSRTRKEEADEDSST